MPAWLDDSSVELFRGRSSETSAALLQLQPEDRNQRRPSKLLVTKLQIAAAACQQEFPFQILSILSSSVALHSSLTPAPS